MVIAAASAQRASFAGLSARGYPELAPRFREAASESPDTSSLDVANRAGEITSTTTRKAPVTTDVNSVVLKRRPSYIVQTSKGYAIVEEPDVKWYPLPSSASPNLGSRAGGDSSTSIGSTTQTVDRSDINSVAAGSRPSFAGSSAKGYPDVAPRFKGIPDVVDRLADTGSTTTERLVVATDELVDRVKQWPRENQPFWVINAQHIENHLHPERQQQQVQARFAIGDDYYVRSKPIRPVQPRSSFLGALQRR